MSSGAYMYIDGAMITVNMVDGVQVTIRYCISGKIGVV